MLRRTWTAMPLIGLILAIAGGCADTIGVGGTGRIEVSMAQSAAAAANVDVTLQDESGAFAVVPTTTFSSITVTVTEVHALAAGADEEADASWIRLEPVDQDVTIDLLALPSEDDGGLLLALGELPVGTYHNVRIFFSAATITLDETVTIGNRTIEAGTHELRIPSGAQTGIKIPSASFTVVESDTEEVTLIFDGTASVQTIVAAGPPQETILQMSPVLTAR